jgi:transcription antitermination protein NusB
MTKKLKSKKTSPNLKRTLSRLMAIQIFYQHNFFGDEKKLDEIKNDVIENYAIDCDDNLSSYREKIDEEFLNNLISGLKLNVEKIDEDISKLLQKGWEFNSLDDVAKEILRFGTFELKFMLDAPLKVIINEYVDIAASFFDSKKITFINGVLENLAKNLRETEYQSLKK